MRLLIRALLLFPILGILTSSKAQTVDSSLLKINATIDIISKNYVDTVNKNKLVEDAIRGMLKKLDPHSSYMNKKEMIEANEPLIGNFEGIGVQFSILNDTVVVISPISGGPSERLGILSGDKIVKVNDSSFVGDKITNNKVLNTLRGKKGTKVKVSMFRHGDKQLIDFDIIRDEIPIYSVDASYMLAPTVGYIKVNRFARTTIQEFHEAIAKLKNQKLEHLVLDLRGNSGGYLNTAIELADEFLDDNKLIVYTSGVSSPRSDYNASFRGKMQKGRVVVLIDEGSASASEILSGAIQDWDRGAIIGRRSFGKGLVQKPFNLPDGSSMRLTIARYYTPSGRCIQKSYADGDEEYEKDLMKRYKKGEFSNKDSIHITDSIKFYTANKRIVYGGGGIMPDIFVPLDTNQNSTYYSKLIRKGLLSTFTLNYLDKNRSDLKVKYPTTDAFVKQFSIDDNLFNQFVEYSEKKGVEKDKKGIKKSRKQIENQLKAVMGRDLFDINVYYEVVNQIEPCMNKALEYILSPQYEKDGFKK